MGDAQSANFHAAELDGRVGVERHAAADVVAGIGAPGFDENAAH